MRADGVGFHRQAAAPFPAILVCLGRGHGREGAESIAANALVSRRVPAFLSFGFRPFFLASALWAAVALAVWIVMLTTGVVLPSRFDRLAWHIHEMLFGFVMAAIAGFLLTAIPNWTGRLPVTGLLLGLLAGSWLLGRLACLVSALLPVWLAIAPDLAFPAHLVSVVAQGIVASRNWRDLPIIAPVTVLGVAKSAGASRGGQCARATGSRLASGAGRHSYPDLRGGRPHPT
jgi:uncharacterized protein involved in response to NO